MVSPTIQTDASLGDTFFVTLTGNTTLADTNKRELMVKIITYEFTQDVTGNRTVAYSGAFRFTTNDPQPSSFHNTRNNRLCDVQVQYKKKYMEHMGIQIWF
jgi:hypothetical protein